LGKVWSARRYILAAQIDCFAARRQWLYLLLAALVTALKLPRDLWSATAHGRRWQEHRRSKVSPEIEQKWREWLIALTRKIDDLGLPRGLEQELPQKDLAHAP
jgi:hypothetical protein